MEDISPAIPYEQRPEKFLLFPWRYPSIVWLPGKLLEWRWKKLLRITGREYIAEYFGTLVFITFVLGGAAQSFYSELKETGWIGGTWGAAIGIFFGMYTCLGVSGAHLNPAVTFALALVGKFSWLKVLFYWIAQFLGSFTASFIVYLYYFDALYRNNAGVAVTNSVNNSYKVWTTNPQDHVSNLNIFYDQLFSTLLLQFLILSIMDRPNAGLVHHLKPVGVSLIVFAVGVCFSYNAGLAMNPIRDFPPRCFAAIIFGSDIFRIHNYYFWIPIIGPMIGAPIGAFIYIFFIETHHYPGYNPSQQNAESRISLERQRLLDQHDDNGTTIDTEPKLN
ncbi:Aquaporin-9-like [Oopsacas minuta]|uniref:Aquaporin-9-like n=1 Tax=Oopsacas minuta TaxID=111878 RepID=A0AAV7JQZ8_9METZ|nr:Aquaporin-9-like [Oopsacas minuta]